jgi:hypothetical protein
MFQRRHRGQVHRRRHHGLLELPQHSARPCCCCLCCSPEAAAPPCIAQGSPGGARATTAQGEDGAEQRDGAARQHWVPPPHGVEPDW